MSGKIDIFLSRVSHISQFVLVAFAIFGYFYTVRPIYQKELLSEDIAKKEIELSSLRQKLHESEIHLDKNRDEQAKLETNISNMNERYVEAKSQLISITNKLSQAEKNLNKQKIITKDMFEKHTHNLEDIYWENLLGLVASRYVIQAGWLANNTSYDNALVLKDYKKLYVTPYSAISYAISKNVSFINVADNIPDSLRDKFNKKVRQEIEKNKKLLDQYPAEFYNVISNADKNIESYGLSNDIADKSKAGEEENKVYKYIYTENLKSQSIAADFINKIRVTK